MELVIGLWCEIFADFHDEKGLLRTKRRILKRSKHIRCPWNWKYRPARLRERAKSLLYNPGILTSRIPFLAASTLETSFKTRTTFFFEMSTTINWFISDKTRYKFSTIFQISILPISYCFLLSFVNHFKEIFLFDHYTWHPIFCANNNE